MSQVILIRLFLYKISKWQIKHTIVFVPLFNNQDHAYSGILNISFSKTFTLTFTYFLHSGKLKEIVFSIIHLRCLFGLQFHQPYIVIMYARTLLKREWKFLKWLIIRMCLFVCVFVWEPRSLTCVWMIYKNVCVIFIIKHEIII